MNYLFTNHRLNRCKTVQVKLPDVSKPLGDTIQVQLFRADEPSRKTFQVQFLDFDKLSRKFPLVDSHILGLAGAEVRIVTKSDITKLRRKGYLVEIVQKLPDLYPVRLVDIFAPTVKPIGAHGIGAIMYDAPDSVVGFGGTSLCCANDENSKRNGGLKPTTGNGRRARAAGMIISQSKNQELAERFIALVGKVTKLAQELDDLGREIVAALPNDETSTPVYGIFRPFVDEKKMSVCFSSIFQKFFGVLPTEKLEGDYNGQIDLVAYLFIIVEWEELGSYVFKEKCKKPFFEYVNKIVLKGKLGVTERTFHNRLTRTMDDFRKKLAEEPLSSKFKNECWKHDFFIKDFLKVLEIFHGTEYYKELAKRKHA